MDTSSNVMEEIQKNNLEDMNNELSKFTNKFIKKISNNLENFSYNIIIANLTRDVFFFNKTN